MLVASDAMTRGMDVEDVANVINYDAPVYAKTYVHRAGRTARAGRPGTVITLLRSEVRLGDGMCAYSGQDVEVGGCLMRGQVMSCVCVW